MNEQSLSRTTNGMAIAWAALFSINSLGSCLLVSLSNADWPSMSPFNKVLLGVGVTVNWTTMLMAFLSKTMARLDAGKPPIPEPGSTGDTDFITKPKPIA